MAISLMALILGFMIALAVNTNDVRTGRRVSDPEQASRLAIGSAETQEKLRKLSEETSKLREENTKLQNAIAEQTGQAKVLNISLQDLKRFAGLVPVTGPGILVSLKDVMPKDRTIDAPLSEVIVHDVDVLKVVNELWNAGAEAISVNNTRVSVGSNFRCVGTTILVDGIKIASPVEIRAIGDSKTLSGALKFPGGIYEELTNTNPGMIEITTVESMKLPAFSGSTRMKLAKPVKEGE